MDGLDTVTARLCGVDRLRIGTDGRGVTSLVSLYGCPLSCRYCINACLTGWHPVTVRELVERLAVDRLYFEATGGGVTFGGHEPLLQTPFLTAFVQTLRELALPWRITVESCLNVPQADFLSVLDYVDAWFVDLKDMDPAIYRSYTGRDNRQVLENLPHLAGRDVILRLPRIPGYDQDVECSVRQLLSMGFAREQLDIFSYVLPENYL